LLLRNFLLIVNRSPFGPSSWPRANPAARQPATRMDKPWGMRSLCIFKQARYGFALARSPSAPLRVVQCTENTEDTLMIVDYGRTLRVDNSL